MATVAIVPQDSRIRAIYLGCRDLPVNYMEDFTIMGFIVDKFKETATLLETAGYRVHERPGGIDVTIEHHGQLSEISELLIKNDIQGSYTDIADTIYQA